MAARDAHGPHPAASQPPVLLYRLIGVVRARRVVAARGRENFRERMLVTADHGQQDRRHGLSFESLRAACSVSAARSAKGASSAAGRAIRTSSYRIPSPCSGEFSLRIRSRATSRNRRRARFRSTEPLTLRLTVTPTRLSSASRGTAKATSVRPVYTRLPPIAAWKSDCRRSRKRRFTSARRPDTESGGGAPCDGGSGPVWRRPSWTCGGESRALAGGSASSADRFA